VCPRCGQEYYFIRFVTRGNQTYAYAVHGSGKNRRYCYLGPVGDYIYVTRTHIPDGVKLTGMMTPDRLVQYLYDIASTIYLRRDKLSEHEKRLISTVIDILRGCTASLTPS